MIMAGVFPSILEPSSFTNIAVSLLTSAKKSLIVVVDFQPSDFVALSAFAREFPPITCL